MRVVLLPALGALLALGASTAVANDLVHEEVDQQTSPRHWSRLPLFGDKARERGYDLPIPVGISFFYNKIDAEYEADNDFFVNVKGGLLGGSPRLNPDGKNYSVPKEDVTIDGEDESYQLKLDAWILPFWNVYALLGHTEGHKDIRAKLDNVEGLPEGVPDGLVLPIPIEYKATNYGLGTVLAGQVEPVYGDTPWIVMGVGAVVHANTNTTDSTIKTRIASIRVGQRFDVRGDKLAWFLAFNHQDVNQNVTGDYDFSGTGLSSIMETVAFDIDLAKKETDNLAFAVNYDFGPQNEWSLYAEYGFLNWDHFILGVGRRF